MLEYSNQTGSCRSEEAAEAVCFIFKTVGKMGFCFLMVRQLKLIDTLM